MEDVWISPLAGCVTERKLWVEQAYTNSPMHSLTNSVHYEVQLAVIDGDIDPRTQEFIHNAHHWLHEVSSHLCEDLCRLAWRVKRT